MKIHEYQAKEMLAKYGVPVPKGGGSGHAEGGTGDCLPTGVEAKEGLHTAYREVL